MLIDLTTGLLESMKDFQNIGILLQLTAMVIFLLKILCTRDCTGLSGQTQILQALVFTTRFLDLPYDFEISIPSFILKIVYLLIAYLTVVSIFVLCRKTYERQHDTFRSELLIGACTVMALLSTYKHWQLLEILWYLSVFLETFAIFPQIHFTSRSKYVGSSLIFYVGMLTCYRAFYVVHWIYLYLAEGRIDNCDVAVAGTAQFLIYCGYFVWLVPIFKAQYANLKLEHSSLQQQQQQQQAIVNVRANGTDDATGKLKPLLNQV